MKLLYVLVSLLVLVVGLISLDESEVQANSDSAAVRAIATHVMEASPDAPDQALDRRIVHVTGTLEADTPITDPDTGVAVRGLSLHRYVEMFQWQHEESFYSTHHKQLWWPSRIPQGPSIVNPKAPTNPVMPFQSQTFDADAPHLGAYQVDNALVAAAMRFQPTQLVPGNPQAGNMLYQGYDPQDPSVGDMKSWYTDSPYQQISVIAFLTGGKLVPVHSTRSAEDLVLLRHGNLDAPALVSSILKSISARRWSFRYRILIAATFGMGLALVAFGPEKAHTIVMASPLCGAVAVAAVCKLHSFVPAPSHATVMLCGAVVGGLCVLAVNKLAKMRFSLAPRWA